MGEFRGSYIWGGQSLQWDRWYAFGRYLIFSGVSDVATQFGHRWHQLFTELELTNGLLINNKWLLHFLFLNEINRNIANSLQ